MTHCQFTKVLQKNPSESRHWLFPSLAVAQQTAFRGFVNYNTDWENEAIKIFTISLWCVWRVRERFLSMRNGFKFLKPVESKRVNLKSFLSRYHALAHTLALNKVLNLYLLNKLWSFRDKSRNSMAIKTTFNFRGCAGEYGPLNWPITACVLT